MKSTWEAGWVPRRALVFFVLQKENHGFLVGMTRRRNPEAEALIDRVDETKWIDCPMGINAREKQADPPRTRVHEVRCDCEGVRVFVVDSDTNGERTKSVSGPNMG